MPTGSRVDDLPTLPLPPAPSDRMFVSRGGLLKRQSFSGLHGGLFTRRTVVTPEIADFAAWVNQGAATLTDDGDVLSLEHSNTITSGTNLKGLERPLPSGNWDVTIGCRRLWSTREYFVGGIFLRETSTGKIEMFGFGHGAGGFGMAHSRFTNPTAFSSDRRASFEYMDIAWFRFRKWAGQFIPLFSVDGVAWAQFDAGIALNNFFAVEPDRWGFMIQPLNNTTPAVAQRMDVFDWSEQTETDLYPNFGNYKNADGQGDRRSRITVTTDAVLGGGSAPIANLVDGTFTNGTSPWWQVGQTGRSLTFQFTEPKIITEAKWFQSASTPHGIWKWQGSSDGASWTDLSASFTLDAGSGGAPIGDLSSISGAYPYYRMLQLSGATSDNPFLREIEFKIGQGR